MDVKAFWLSEAERVWVWGNGGARQFGIELDEVTSENVMVAKQHAQKDAEIGADDEVQ